MAGKKRKQLSNKQIIMITLTILGVGMLMLVASILLAPAAENPEADLPQTAQGAAGQSSWGVDLTEESAVAQSEPTQQTVKPTQSTQSSTVQSKPQQTSSASTAQTQAQQNTSAQSASKPTQQTQTQAKPQQAQSSQSNNSQITHTPSTSGAKLVFVFDDAGHNLTQLEPFLKLPFKVDIAVLPSLPHSAEAAAAIRKAGKETMLHQPMQAVNLSVDPGPSAITPDMHTYEIEELVRKNIAAIGPIKGLNNHEGSLITATQSAIGAVLDVCKDEGIFFLDSRTNSETKAPQAAQERGMKIYERDIFLDNSQNKKDIIAMIEKGLAVADKKGYAIMIGHVWSDGLAAILEELYPELVAKGYVFTDISGLK